MWSKYIIKWYVKQLKEEEEEKKNEMPGTQTLGRFFFPHMI